MLELSLKHLIQKLYGDKFCFGKNNLSALDTILFLTDCYFCHYLMDKNNGFTTND